MSTLFSEQQYQQQQEALRVRKHDASFKQILNSAFVGISFGLLVISTSAVGIIMSGLVLAWSAYDLVRNLKEGKGVGSEMKELEARHSQQQMAQTMTTPSVSVTRNWGDTVQQSRDETVAIQR